MGLQSYETGDVIAQSSSTRVCRAVRKADGARVVLKTLSRAYPSAREIGQLEFEYRILRKLADPCIVRALDLHKDGNGLVLVLEDFGGQSLAGRDAPMPIAVFFDVAIAAARVLGQVHAGNVIHKDVTLGNILLNPATGVLKLIDFGIASELSHEHQGADPSTHLEGTLPYLSPEQTGRMNRDLDYRTDYYSLGVCFFELLTGSLPFSADDVMGWVHCHISKAAPSARERNPSVPEPLARIVRKLMSKNPEDRYQSSHGLVRDLERCRDQWRRGEPDAPFALGAHDVPERFHVSQTLFGRESEAAALRSAFDRASRGGAELVCVGGHSGVGKSALIHELYKEIVATHGLFIAGKYDQLERHVPFAALIQALRGLVKQLLREPEERLRAWQRKLCAAVGANGRVLVDLAAELEQVLGPQPPVPVLQPREAQARLLRVLFEFIKAAAQPEHPIVLFVDDLQWADPSTTEFLVYLLSDPTLKHLLVIAAYRDNEVPDGHVLRTALGQIRERRPDAITSLSLSPLDERSVNEIVADTLRCDRTKSGPLAALVTQKTGGNPFFVKELLGALDRAGAFRFVAAEGRWEWDIAKIQAAAVSDNVVDFIVDQLRRLPAATIEALRLAACIGNQFDLQTLALVAERPAGQVAAALRSAVEERVLIPLGSGYRLVQQDHDYDRAGLDALAVRYQFQHDRVQQAAYTLLGADERTVAHARIGRLLLAATGPAQREERVFELVNHLNLGRPLLRTLEERSELLRLNELASAKAKRAAAYVIARAYLDTAAALLTPDEWSAQPKRLFQCRRESIECLYLAGNVEQALTMSEDLVASAPDTRCHVAALELKARVLEQQARLFDAIEAYREGLRLLGLELPRDPADIERQIGAGIGTMQGHLAKIRIEDLAGLPEMTDEDKILTTNLLFQLVVPAIQANPPLFVLAELLLFDLAVTHGRTPVSCKVFVDCGIIQGPVLGDFERAYRLGKTAFEFLRDDTARPFSAAVTFVFASFVSHWRAPFRESLEAFADAERWGLELGDLWHVSYVQALSHQRWFFTGQPLESCRTKAEGSFGFLRQARADNQLNGVLLAHRAAARLRGSPADQALLRDETEEAFTKRLEDSHNAQWLFLHGHGQALTSYVLGDVASAHKWHALAGAHMQAGGNIQFSLPDHHLIDVLLTVDRLAGAPEAERPALLQQMEQDEAKLKTWAEHCPQNFAHKFRLASAEIARARGTAMETVVSSYVEAVRAAGDDFAHMKALINERHADYWAHRGYPKIARLFLEEAYFLYERWGARAKLALLRRGHPGMFEGGQDAAAAAARRTVMTTTHRTGIMQGGSLDVESMIKATHSISGEVKPEKLFARLMDTIIENAGAQRGCLILHSESGGELTVEAAAHVDGDRRERKRSARIEECDDLCADIVRYVARTRDTVVLDDAAHDPHYKGDAYVAKNEIKSVLCLPILHQGKLLAILYAENNAATHAFTSERLRLLQIIASQAAISITNARLYDSLEEKVVERTRELMERNNEIAAMLNSMQQGVFTIDEELAIQPRYSAHLEQILGIRDIAGRDMMEVVFGGADLGDDAVAAMRTALQFSFGAPTFMAEVNWVHLVTELSRKGPDGQPQFLAIDWNGIADENGDVRKVLVAVRDVTAIRELNLRMAKNARELDIVGQILEAGPGAFRRFVDVTHTATDEALAVLHGRSRPGREQLELVFRNVHTVKGNARMLGLSHLVDTIHRVEETYVQLRSDPNLAPDVPLLVSGIREVLAALDEYDDVCTRKLGEATRPQDARQAAAFNAIGATVRDALSGGLDAALALAHVDAALKKAAAVPVREIVDESARMLPSLARELGKAAPTVDCADARVTLLPAWAGVMREVLVHTFRNALDHGIEREEERTLAGKPAQGKISIVCARGAGRILVRVFDDGAGLRLESLREKTGNRTGSDEEVADLVFLSGVSTAAQVSRISGRGVGLDAVRSSIRRQGGDVRIVFTGAAHDGCRPFEIVLDLPEEAALSETRASKAPPRFPDDAAPSSRRFAGPN